MQNHLLTCLRFAARANPDKLEQALYPPFVAILQGDVQGKQRMCDIVQAQLTL